MHILLVGLLAACLTLAGTANAFAAPLTIALFGAAFAATTAGAIVSVIFSTVISIGVSLLAQSLLKKDQQQQADPGIEFEVQMGDTVPIGFPIGETATAGSREYIGAWGVSGGTPNAYLVDVLTISDIPLPGQPGLWLGDTKCTILWDATPVDQGYPIEEFRVNGVDYAWVKYQDGTQTEVDAYLFAKFGEHPEHPWTDDMIGVGEAYVIITTLMNRDLFSGEPKKLIEPPVARLYDVRKDSTAGGDGDHRWGDWSTYEPSTNAKVLEYNILRGIYYGDNEEWMFGGQNLPAFRLPASNWIAAMNACDDAVELSEGGDEPAYRAGMYVTGDLEPLQVVEELRKASNSRTAEDGGVFRTLVGLPASAVYAFTDDDILITEGQSFEPFPNLDNTNNVVEATYPEPREQWRDKDAPARRNEDAIEEDGGRELPVSVRFTAVPYANQVQRLQLAQSQDDRRFRIHSFSLPPDSWLLSAGVDEVSWTSARNGYSNKKFLVLKIAGKRNSCQLVMLKEVEAGDFDWDTEYELPEAVGPIGPLPVPAQPMTGWQVFADYLQDSGGSKQRASIRVEFDANQVDVGWVRVQARIKANGSLQFDAEIPYADVEGDPKAVILNGVFLPSTVYEVRGKFIPYSTRQTEWSDWLEVTTPSVPDVEMPPEYFVLKQRIEELEGELRPMKRSIATLARTVIEEQQTIADHNGQLFKGIGTAFGDNKALIERTDTVVATINAALAEIFEGTYATTSGGEAETLFKMASVSDTVSGALALIRFAVRAGFGGQMCEAALEMAAFYSAENGYHTRMSVKADFFDMQVKIGGSYVTIPALGLRNGSEVPTVPIVAGSPNTVTPDLRARHVSFYTDLTDDCTYGWPLGTKLGDAWYHTFRQDSGGGNEITFDPMFYIQGEVSPQADPDGDNDSVFRFLCTRLSPPTATVVREQAGRTAFGSVTMLSFNPPLDGVAIFDLNDGDVVIEGYYEGEVTALGEDGTECNVEMFGPGGSCGGLSYIGYAVTQPTEGTDTEFDGMVAGAGTPSESKALVYGVFGNGSEPGEKGVAIGGDTNTDGTDGTRGGSIYIGQFYGWATTAPAAPSPGGASIAEAFATGTSVAVAGNSPGGAARGPAFRGNPSPPEIDGISAPGSGAKVVKQYGSGNRLTGTKPIIVGDAGTPGTGNIANGAKGGFGRVKFSKIP